MQVSMICCPFQTSFGSYGSSLKAALEKTIGRPVQWVASNCGCGDPIEVNRQYQAKDCDYFEMPVLGDYRSPQAWKRRVRGAARTVMFSARARRFASLSRGAEVVHFQQVLNAYGSKVVFSWLKQPSKAVRIVTVHELDADQLESKETNRTYNRADGIIVHCDEMKQQLVRLNVQPEKIHVVFHGTCIPEPVPDVRRVGIVFYGGHKLMSSKGIETLMQAMAIIQRRLAPRVSTLTIHGHYGTTTPPAAVELAAKHGVADRIVWLNQIPDEDVVRLYQRSQVCALPYTGSFAGGAAALAAACGLPVVCTLKAGLPDHLGESGIWVPENDAAQLADRIVELLSNDELRSRVADRSLRRAQGVLRWDVIAEQTLRIYRGENQSEQAA